MKLPNKKYRKMVYMKVASNYHNRVGWGLCSELANCCEPKMEILWWNVETSFPELVLFKPDVFEGKDNRWWENDDIGSRVIALLLCAEMCK